MPLPPPTPTTALGAAIQARREGRSSITAGQEVGVTHSTMLRLERGTVRPSADTARSLANWLGWTMEQVLDAADTPLPLG
jgi:DNA-binding XRE family transcriptional regulator